MRYNSIMGKKTSFYLSDELAAEVEASGLSVRQLVEKALREVSRASILAEIRALRTEVRAVLRELK